MGIAPINSELLSHESSFGGSEDELLALRKCSARTALNFLEIFAQKDHTCFSLFLTGGEKATRSPLTIVENCRGGLSEKPWYRRAITNAAAKCVVNPYFFANLKLPMIDVYAGFT